MGVTFIGKSAFDAVYEANVDQVYRTALHYSENHHVAEEITQSVFMKLYVNMDNIQMGAVARWLWLSAKHMALNYKRDNEREILCGNIEDIEEIEEACGLVNEPEPLEEFYFNAIENAKRFSLLEEMLIALYRFNEMWHDAWTITYILEKPKKEVAESMGISYENLRQILSRTNRWMARQFEEQYRLLDKA